MTIMHLTPAQPLLQLVLMQPTVKLIFPQRLYGLLPMTALELLMQTVCSLLTVSAEM